MKPSKTSTKLISIPKPCHEKWDDMSQMDKGRFCSKCATTVVDFTQKTKTEIKQFFEVTSAKICGRFRNDQLDVALIPVKTQPKKIRIFTCALYLVFGSLLFSCSQGHQTSSRTEVNPEPRTIPEDLPIMMGEVEPPSILNTSDKIQVLIDELEAQNEKQQALERELEDNYVLGFVPPLIVEEVQMKEFLIEEDVYLDNVTPVDGNHNEK